MTNPDASEISPIDSAKTVRRLAHDLSNALEIIMQSSFLLGTLDLGESGRQWHQLLDGGVEKAVTINRQLREVLRAELAHSDAESHGTQ